MGYADNIQVNGVIIGLIFIGGIGFLTWEDICEYKWKFKSYRMQSKLILATTVCLIIFPACSWLLKVATAFRRSTANVVVFIPPAVEPGDPPINIRSIMTTLEARNMQVHLDGELMIR